MNKVLNVYKPISYTPLQAINALKEKFPEYKDEKISYAGRLDPLAHGVLVLLVGDENQKRGDYEKMDKVYEFKCIIGAETDTYDVLGLPRLDEKIFEKSPSEKQIRTALMKFQGTIKQQLPPFSSYQIDRIPLFKWARMGRLDEIEIPKRDVEISSMELLKIEQVAVKSLLKTITERVSNVNGDFRQKEIVKRWNNILGGHGEKVLTILTARAQVSSGTYIRSICYELGKNLGTSAVALEIYRTRAGEYKVEDSLKVANNIT